SLGVLSTGAAREYNSMILQTPFKDGSLKPTARASVVPAGFPKPAAGCPQENDVYDVADLRVELKVPANAKGIGFDFNFYSSEWPDFVCTPFNDSFIAYLSSKAFNGGKPDNISFDAKKNPVSVNNGFFDICSSSSITACGQDLSSTHPGACAQGPNELGGTGFGLSLPFCGKQDLGGGATGWLTSQAPVTPGEVVTIDFMIWNTGDQDLDSVVLLDNFRFEAGETTVSTSRPPPR
ncbi:MAG: choice-of-anchor L domain-containing protein, partial [Polyangiaceae bacterium]